MSQKIRRIYCLCPDDNTPYGGIRKTYNHVDILRELDFQAFVLHTKWGFRCDWFQSESPVVYMSTPFKPLTGLDKNGNKYELPALGPEDILVIPELYAFQTVPYLAKLHMRGVIFNQNPFLSFTQEPFPTGPLKAENEGQSYYLDPQILGALVVSNDSKRYLKFAFPDLTVYRIHNSINSLLFSYQPEKKKQIAFMLRKYQKDCLQVIQIIKARNRLKEWTFNPIDNLSEVQVAEILKESALFLSFSHQEGFGMPPVEAMACGCVVIGYHGQGGKEYLKPPYAHAIASGDIVHFVETVEKIALDYDQYKNKGKLASEYILKHYSREQEKKDFKRAWHALLSSSHS